MTSLSSTVAARDEAARPASGAIAIGMFGLFGTALVAGQPGMAETLVAAAFLSAMASGLAVIAAQDELETPFGRGLRLAVRLAGAALAACLLWLSIAAAQAVAPVTLATALAVPGFVGALALEAVLGALVTIGFARLAGAAAGGPLARLISDKYSGLAGEIR